MTTTQGRCDACRMVAPIAPSVVLRPAMGVRWACRDLAACCRRRGIR